MTTRPSVGPAARPAEAPTGPARVDAAGRPCRCGHARELHEHYRRGTDCASCDCPRFRGRPRNPVAAVLAAVRSRSTAGDDS